MLKQILAVVAGVGVALGVLAADVALKDDHPDTYVVQRGDTLWDIAGKFLAKPWLWPEIWQGNPQVENPHRIYPGDVLRLVWIDGKPRLVAGGGGERPPSGPRIRAQPLSDASTAVPLSKVRPFLEKVRIVDQADYDAMPYVVAVEGGKLRAAPGNAVYVRGLDAAPGTRIVVLRATNEYREVPDSFPWEEARRRVDAQPLESMLDLERPDWYWSWALNWTFRRQTEYLGTEAMEIADGEVLRDGDPATVLLQSSEIEIRPGDRIVAGGALPFDLTFSPRAPRSVPDNLRVVSLARAFKAAGPGQVIAVSRGARDGLENGQVFSLFRPGEAVADTVRYPDGSLLRTLAPDRTKVTLPDEFVGHVMVFRTFDRVAYALFMDGRLPVQPGDILREPAN